MSETDWTYKNWRHIPGRSHHQVAVTVYRYWRNEEDYPCVYWFSDVDEALDFWRDDYLALNSKVGDFWSVSKIGDVKIKVFDGDHTLLECVDIDPFEYLCMSDDEDLPIYERPQCRLPIEAKLALETDLPELLDLIKGGKTRDLYEAERVLHDLEFTLEEHGLIACDDS